MPGLKSRMSLPVLAAALIGLTAGLGIYTFVYARGAAYLTNDPAACGNCHVMREHVAAWERSSHRAVAVCNDCHAPHNSVVSKYLVKGENGARHSWAFTTGRFPDVILITAGNRRVTEQACFYCHREITDAISAHRPSSGTTGAAPSCLVCHASVGHLTR